VDMRHILNFLKEYTEGKRMFEWNNTSKVIVVRMNRREME